VKVSFRLLIIAVISYRVLCASTAYETLRGHASTERGTFFYNYAFDLAFSTINTSASLWGLSRFNKHQDELNVLYASNLLIGSLMLYRSFSIMSAGGLFHETYRGVKKVKDKKLREIVAEYRLRELSNSIRQYRRITSTVGLLSSIFIAAFSEGRSNELVTGMFIGFNSLFYMLFYNSYGEDAYDKYFFYKKAYPQLSYIDNIFRLTLNFKF